MRAPPTPTAAAATILLVRHGEARGNAEGRFIGQQDVPLTDKGHRQAASLAAQLLPLPITRIVSSDLSRCVDTVRPLAGTLGLEVEPDPRLREISNGRWGGLLPEEIEARWPEMFRRYRHGEDVPRPGGETWHRVSLRVAEALDEIALGGGIVAVGTHAGPIGTAARRAAGVPATDRAVLGGVSNTSVTILRYPGPRLIAFGTDPVTARASVGLLHQRREDR